MCLSPTRRLGSSHVRTSLLTDGGWYTCIWGQTTIRNRRPPARHDLSFELEIITFVAKTLGCEVRDIQRSAMLSAVLVSIAPAAAQMETAQLKAAIRVCTASPIVMSETSTNLWLILAQRKTSHRTTRRYRACWRGPIAR